MSTQAHLHLNQDRLEAGDVVVVVDDDPRLCLEAFPLHLLLSHRHLLYLLVDLLELDVKEVLAETDACCHQILGLLRQADHLFLGVVEPILLLSLVEFNL